MKSKAPQKIIRKPLCIGLLGGVASGKSTVARELERLGATILDADKMAHEVLGQLEIAAAVRAKLGPEIVGADGSLDRKKIAAKVFADASLKTWLEGQIHPRVREKIVAGIAAAGEAGTRAVVLDVPLLAEGPLLALCDTTIFVDAPTAQRQARAQKERGWAPDELTRRESHQAALQAKRALAANVIENSGSLEELRSKVRICLDNLLQKS